MRAAAALGGSSWVAVGGGEGVSGRKRQGGGERTGRSGNQNRWAEEERGKRNLARATRERRPTAGGGAINER